MCECELSQPCFGKTDCKSEKQNHKVASSSNRDLLCADGDHELDVIDDSYDHEYGCEQVFYYRCSVCDATHDEDSRIPENVED